MKIYKTKDLKEPIEILDLGILPAGETMEYRFWIQNDSSAYLTNLEFIVDHMEVEVIKFPKDILAHSSDFFVVKWSPSINVKEGLKVEIKIRGKELYG